MIGQAVYRIRIRFRGRHQLRTWTVCKKSFSGNSVRLTYYWLTLSSAAMDGHIACNRDCLVTHYKSAAPIACIFGISSCAYDSLPRTIAFAYY